MSCCYRNQESKVQVDGKDPEHIRYSSVAVASANNDENLMHDGRRHCQL